MSYKRAPYMHKRLTPFSASKNQTAELVANFATYIKVFAQYLARPKFNSFKLIEVSNIPWKLQ